MTIHFSEFSDASRGKTISNESLPLNSSCQISGHVCLFRSVSSYTSDDIISSLISSKDNVGRTDMHDRIIVLVVVVHRIWCLDQLIRGSGNLGHFLQHWLST